jgi:hypothetical protein
MHKASKPGLTLTLHPVNDPQRLDIESFIARVYWAHFAADLQNFAPILACRA